MNLPRMEYQGGTEEAGYSLDADPDRQRFTVKMWGRWDDPELVPKFKTEVLICMKVLAQKGEWNVFGDLRGYKLQLDVIGELITSLMREAMQRKFSKAGVLHDSAMVELFISRLTKAAGMTTLKFFKTAKEVEAYLRES